MNLQVGDEPFKNVALHFNPRASQRQVVMNTMKEGDWQHEELIDVRPFAIGKPFTIKIKCKLEGFLIAVNGAPFYLYGHRTFPQEIDHINVTGDAHVTYVAAI